MSNKHSYEVFINDVVNRSEKLSLERDGVSLSDRYEAPSTVTKMICAVARAGQKYFSGLAGLLANTSYFAFAAALALFIVSPIGTVVLGALVYWGGKDSLKVLYNNRDMVLAVKSVADKYKLRLDRCASESEYDELVNQAAEELCCK